MKTVERWRALSGRSTEMLPILFAGAVIGASVLPGQASGQAGATADPAWAKVVSAARQEGRLFLYSAVPTPITARLKADFEKAYPESRLGTAALPAAF